MEKGAEEIHLLSWWGDEGRGQCTIGISAATSKGTKEDVGQAHAVVTSAGAPKTITRVVVRDCTIREAMGTARSPP